MVPMIASLSELREVKALWLQAVEDVRKAGHPLAERIPLGIMVEVPSAAIMARELARESEFLSIGTNDLVQYRVGRGSHQPGFGLPGVPPFDPAILRLIRGVLEAGQTTSRPVIVCGAMASDPLAALLLVGMGLRTLSMEAAAIPKVKASIGRVTLVEAQELAQEAIGVGHRDGGGRIGGSAVQQAFGRSTDRRRLSGQASRGLSNFGRSRWRRRGRGAMLAA